MSQKKRSVKLSSFARDVKAANEGRWFNIEEDFRIKLASTSSPEYKSFIRRKAKSYKRQIDRGRLDAKTEEKVQPILREACARFLVRDWEGLEDDNDVEVPFSEEKSVELLTSERFAPLYEIIMDIVQNEASFAEESLEEDEGNSLSTSLGGLSTDLD